MKVVKIISSGLEAQMISNLLNSNDIEVFINGSKEYASIITGSDEGRFEIKVTEENFEKAVELLKAINTPAAKNNESNGEGDKSTSLPMSTSSMLKRAVLFAVMGSFYIPVIFNLSSLYYMSRYIKEEKSSPGKFIWIFVIIALNILSVIAIRFFYRISA